MVERLPFPFSVSTKTITRAMTRTNRNQSENLEESIKGVVEGLTVVALLCSIISLIPQIGSLLRKNCGASNQPELCYVFKFNSPCSTVCWV